MYFRLRFLRCGNEEKTFRCWCLLYARYAREANKRIKSVSKDTLDLFQSYPWPVTPRIAHVIERSIILATT